MIEQQLCQFQFCFRGFQQIHPFSKSQHHRNKVLRFHEAEILFILPFKIKEKTALNIEVFCIVYSILPHFIDVGCPCFVNL